MRNRTVLLSCLVIVFSRHRNRNPGVSALACEFVLQASREVVQTRRVVVKALQVRDERGPVMWPSLQVLMPLLQLSVLRGQRIPYCLKFGSHTRLTAYFFCASVFAWMA
jgi:hypothetical protein